MYIMELVTINDELMQIVQFVYYSVCSK